MYDKVNLVGGHIKIIAWHMQDPMSTPDMIISKKWRRTRMTVESSRGLGMIRSRLFAYPFPLFIRMDL